MPRDCSGLASEHFERPEGCVSEWTSESTCEQQALVSLHEWKRMAWPCVPSQWLGEGGARDVVPVSTGSQLGTAGTPGGLTK